MDCNNGCDCFGVWEAWNFNDLKSHLHLYMVFTYDEAPRSHGNVFEDGLYAYNSQAVLRLHHQPQQLLTRWSQSLHGTRHPFAQDNVGTPESCCAFDPKALEGLDILHLFARITDSRHPFGNVDPEHESKLQFCFEYYSSRFNRGLISVPAVPPFDKPFYALMAVRTENGRRRSLTAGWRDL